MIFHLSILFHFYSSVSPISLGIVTITDREGFRNVTLTVCVIFLCGCICVCVCVHASIYVCGIINECVILTVYACVLVGLHILLDAGVPRTMTSYMSVCLKRVRERERRLGQGRC